MKSNLVMLAMTCGTTSQMLVDSAPPLHRDTQLFRANSEAMARFAKFLWDGRQNPSLAMAMSERRINTRRTMGNAWLVDQKKRTDKGAFFRKCARALGNILIPLPFLLTLSGYLALPLKAKIALPVAISLVRHHWYERREKERSVDAIHTSVKLNENYHVSIVTTAVLPLLTGTAINPVLRAAYLAKAGKPVTLVVPWLHPLDQSLVFSEDHRFMTPAAQEAFIRKWVSSQGASADFRLVFYPARYDSSHGRIMPLGDITSFVAPTECDVCVLEEPEHLTWYHSGESWRRSFKLVVGVVHSNYKGYADFYGSKLQKMTVGTINYCMCRAYVDAVIKLSNALQSFPNSITTNVHGVRPAFLEIGRSAAWQANGGGVYFLSKARWHKGYRALLDLLEYQRDLSEPLPHVDVYGAGEDLDEIKAEAQRMKLNMGFYESTPHDSRKLRSYKVFVNPSESEVLSTTIAEALAMQKFVLLKRHPSNTFFEQFPNALFYETPQEFLLQLRYALLTTPLPLTEFERYLLSWDGATDRFLEAITDVAHGNLLPSVPDRATELIHKLLLPGNRVGDATRRITGAGPVANQAWLRRHIVRGDMDVVQLVEESIKQRPPSNTSFPSSTRPDMKTSGRLTRFEGELPVQT